MSPDTQSLEGEQNERPIQTLEELGIALQKYRYVAREMARRYIERVDIRSKVDPDDIMQAAFVEAITEFQDKPGFYTWENVQRNILALVRNAKVDFLRAYLEADKRDVSREQCSLYDEDENGIAIHEHIDRTNRAIVTEEEWRRSTSLVKVPLHEQVLEAHEEHSVVVQGEHERNLWNAKAMGYSDAEILRETGVDDREIRRRKQLWRVRLEQRMISRNDAADESHMESGLA